MPQAKKLTQFPKPPIINNIIESLVRSIIVMKKSPSFSPVIHPSNFFRDLRRSIPFGKRFFLGRWFRDDFDIESIHVQSILMDRLPFLMYASSPLTVLKFIQAITGAEQKESTVAISTMVVIEVERTESKAKDPTAKTIRKVG